MDIKELNIESVLSGDQTQMHHFDAGVKLSKEGMTKTASHPEWDRI